MIRAARPHCHFLTHAAQQFPARDEAPYSSMPMGMVHVRNMGMRVTKPFVPMLVGMRFSDWIILCV